MPSGVRSNQKTMKLPYYNLPNLQDALQRNPAILIVEGCPAARVNGLAEPEKDWQSAEYG